ncbi:MAG: hypothetical protein J2P23_10920 [Microlunatus sp.]|nr:hypothetical protein [Microlunatus sp.]
MIKPPVFDSIDSYAARLGDVAYWRPYAEAALAGSGLSDIALDGGFEGTYPTLVGEQLVVKLFGCFPGWRESVDAEMAANRLIEKIDQISAPRIVASGRLFPGDESDWPFLITERLNGKAWREAELEAAAAESVASQLGAQIRFLHNSGPVDLTGGRDDWIAAHGGEALERHREWGTLPDHLINQIPDYGLQ